ncbi:MAG: long-chain-fatty-acid--CoA ligase [Desulfobacteraceae bacterium]
MGARPKEIFMESCRYKEGLFGDIILRNALFYGDREAFVYGDQRITFELYNRRVNRLIHALGDMGVRKGDVLGVLSWDCGEYMDVFGAAEKGGFIISPFNVRLSAQELEYLINDSECETLFVGPELAEVVESIRPKIPQVKRFISFESPLPGMACEDDLLANYPTDEPNVAVGDEDPLFICYTSGTTGRPRGALYTHGRLREDVICHALEVPIGSKDKGISLMPLFHIGGIIIRAYFFYQAVTKVILKYFDPRTLLEVIEKERVTDVALVPTHLALMLDLPDFGKYDVSSIKRLYYAGSPMPTELLRRGMKIFGSVFFQGYGQTESGPDVAYLKEEDHDVLERPPEEQERLLSAGHPAVGVHVRIVDEKGIDVVLGEVGEIIVKSRHVMKEYWKSPEETKEAIVDGWLHTGDIGRYDEDGYIYIVDRKKDMIVSGGENIYPRAVEEILYRHPAVLECAVFGIPDPKWIEAVHAVVTLKKGATASAEELIKFCKENMASYKVPKSAEIVQQMPKSATGKILKKELRKKYWA